MSWKKLSTKEVYRNKWMHVTEDEVESDGGKELTFGVVHKTPFALIVPWDGKHLTLVGQYRYPIGTFSWEFPAGQIEDGTILETAYKELEEETGLQAQEIKAIGNFFVVPGHHTQACYVFLATGLSQGKSKREESEADMQIRAVTIEEFQTMVTKGEIVDGPTIAAFALLKIKEIL